MTLKVGLPHSEIRGSKAARASPRLIATCYVLHRLSVPRHPPNALKRLIQSIAHREQKTVPHEATHTQHFVFGPDPDVRKNSRSLNPGTPSRSRASPEDQPEGQPLKNHRRILCIRSTMSNNAQEDRHQESPPLHPLVEPNGIEPMTSCLQSRRSPS